MELVDLPTIGGKFTWFKSNGKAMSRLDRFLLSECFIEDKKVDGQYIGERDVSDHAPIWLKNNRKDWGPKPFKFNNLWLNHEGFDNFVEEEWNNLVVKGRGDYCLVEKLKILKSRISWWNKTVYGWIDLKIDIDVKEMHALDNLFVHFAGFFKEEICTRPEPHGIDLKVLPLGDSLDLEKPFSEKEIKEAIWSCDGNKSPGPDGFSLEFFKRFWFLLKEDLMKLCNDFFSKGTLVKAISSSFLALIPKKKNPQGLSEYRPICLVGSIYKILAKILAARIRGVLDKVISTNQTAFVPGRSMMDGVLMVNEILDWAKRKKKGCLLLKVDFEKAYDSISWNYLRWIMRRMGFGKKWMNWMESCIFSSHMSVLVNGSATKEFKVHRGLRQGDPISPFLFVIAMEGLSALMRKSIEVGDFQPFKYGEDDFVDILQFADDTVIIGEPTSDNLWSMKVILRGFELVSGLKINFHKSNFFGTNIGDWLYSSATSFLSCKKGSFPFKFLGIWVGERANKTKVWKDVVNNIKARLSVWKGRNISIGGRVTLIGSVLNAIPIFTLSFYKAPSKIIKEIRGLLSNFLWNGNANKRSIHWVKWENVCKPKEKGGLGIRDVGDINRALLLKWKWRILKEDNAIWSRFLLLRYHNPKFKVLASCGDVLNRGDSSWWRDIILNDFKEENSVEGFTDWINCECKNGKNILFWHSCWLGDQTLRDLLPHLFDISTNKLCKVSDIISWNNGVFSWNINDLFGMDGVSILNLSSLSSDQNGIISDVATQLRDLKASLERFTPINSENDVFHWKLNPSGVFSVASVTSLVSNAKDNAWPIHTIKLLEKMWKSKVPKMVHIFSWGFFIDRLPLKDLLLHRGVSNFTSLDCVLCSNHPESSLHLFFHCNVSKAVWGKVYNWLGEDVEFNLDEFKSFGSIQEKVKNHNIRIKLNSIWLAIIWCIWLMRNAIIFENASFSFETVISNIMFFSWRWLGGSVPIFRTHFYDWYKLPLNCFNSL
ncbi:uncharacterized protein LOC131634822 [Vicia villosa]|uniref:uncharacterized protein LOC131634822 n=1 Tax=Vicia villosa TaxID=3911 RepID=UPI00273CBBE5|nr:uncharacterized protein LOC131634822 [Vicia villosa]